MAGFFRHTFLHRGRGLKEPIVLLVSAILLQVFLVTNVHGQSEGDVRLMDGRSPYEGRPEYFIDGVWVSLCGYPSYTSSTVLKVICTQLGYQSDGAQRYYANSYGQAPGETYRRPLYCSSAHTNLSQCTIGSNEFNCDPRYTLGVSCNNATSTTTIRLQDGSNTHEGRIEVFRNGVWGTVCRYHSSSYVFHAINAHVACRELFGPGYGGMYYPQHETPSRFGILEFGAIHEYYVRCNGNETSLSECSSHFAGTQLKCLHDRDATVKCYPVPAGCVEYHAAVSGNVTSPLYPAGHNFTEDTECIWKIRTTRSGGQVQLSFTDIDAHSASSSGNSITVTDSNQFRGKAFSTGAAIPDVVSSSTDIYIRQKTLANNQGIDFSASWDTYCNKSYSYNYAASPYIHSLGYYGLYPAGLDCYYRVQFAEEFTVSVQFARLHLDAKVNGECQDYLEIFDGNSVSDPSLGRFCGGPTIIPPTVTMNQSDVLIHFHTDDNIDTTSTGFSLYVKGLEPTPVKVNWTGNAGVITSPDYPDFYTNETDYIWYITALPDYLSITLTFTAFSGSCSWLPRSRLWIYDDHVSTSQQNLLADPCGSGLPIPAVSNTNVMRLHLSSSAYTSTGNKFRATWRADCRKTFRSLSGGSIVSPESPNSYPVFMDCVYLITVEIGYYIELNFSSFDLAGSVGQCNLYDYVEVRDGSTENSNFLAGPFCGGTLPPLVTSSSNAMWIKFHSDGINDPGITGFQATYVTHIKECESQTLTGNTGTFTSPGYPYGYPRSTYCVWTITVPHGLIVKLTFDDFAVGTLRSFCYHAHVRIYDGDTVDASTVMDTLCGATIVPAIISSGRSLTVVLNSYSSSIVEYVGFNASFTSAPSASFAQKGLFPFGMSQGDDVLGTTTDHIFVSAGIPFGDRTEYDFFVATNGLVSVVNAYPWPNLLSSRKMICVYCAYINNSDSVGGIYYQQYGAGDTGILNKATLEVLEYTGSTSFTATTVLVFTWDRVRQGRYRAVDFDPALDEGEATFQLALISDGETSYALVYYKFEHMTWTYRGIWSYVIIGMSTGDTYLKNPYSTKKKAYIIDGSLGNTGRLGTWLYKAGKVITNPTITCSQWLTRNHFQPSQQVVGFSQLPLCPCSQRDVWRKLRFMWVKTRSDPAAMTECWSLNRAIGQQHYPYGKECCYSLDPSVPATYLQLIPSPPEAGHSLAYNPSFPELRADYLREDKLGHDSCCHYTGIPAVFCAFFEARRPIHTCQADIPFNFGWLFGDPHITTLDEREYTFNGHGEYTVLSINEVNFVLQGRTERAIADDGSEVDATVFTAFGAEENGTRVFVGLDPTNKSSLVVFGAGVGLTRRFRAGGKSVLMDDMHFTVRREQDSVVVTFASRISLQISVGIRSLVLGVIIPKKFKSKTSGLMGNYNDDPNDDFVFPNGTVLSSSPSDREIHEFGNAWAVTAASSVLRYGPRETPASYAHPEYTPFFLDDVTVTDYNAGKAVCGDDRSCIYDYLVTGSQEFALRTRAIRKEARRQNAARRNTLPTLTVPANVTAVSNEPVMFSVTATDPDIGDTVEYLLLNEYNGALQINQTTGVITASLDINTPLKLMVYAMDSNDGQSLVMTIPVIVCSGCSGRGTCDYDNVHRNTGNLNFMHATCICPDGWSGDDCSDNHDACLSSPCHPLQSCTDLTPDQQDDAAQGYTCSTCPPGYTSPDNPHQCLDIDECQSAELNNCEHSCNNTAGSFFCSCPEGFRLAEDRRSCEDINECAENPNVCQHLCVNTEGSFRCECHEGFYLDNSRVCIPDLNTQAVCANNSCDHDCRALTDPGTGSDVAKCFCRTGYDLDTTDETSCHDYDECEDELCDHVCSNTDGDYACSCRSGFQIHLDQHTCSPCTSQHYGVQCLKTCGCNGREVDCHPVVGCVCAEGWTGSTCDEDVDECQDPDVCAEGLTCSNTLGSYSCECQDGYVMDQDGQCQDVDECSSGTECIGIHEQCTNVPGTFYCTCQPGFIKDNGVCKDVNECMQVNQNDCQHVCVNVEGSFNCECHYGYQLSGDQASCSLMFNPCEGESLNCEHGCTQPSDPNDDTAMCFCHVGYTLHSNGQDCIEINECLQADVPCSHNCTNTAGGFLCSCPPGMMLDNDASTCVGCPNGTYGEACSSLCACGPGASSCDAVDGCVCMTGWTGDKCQQDVNECDESSRTAECQQKEAACVNLEGSYTCHCDTGYWMGGNGTCEECPHFRFGDGCNQICDCSPGNTELCDHVDGTCHCADSWEGSSCDVAALDCRFGLVEINGVCTLDCNEEVDGSFHPDPSDCAKYYRCVHRSAISHNCSAGTVFNTYINNCDHLSNVDCVDGVRSTETTTTTPTTATSPTTTTPTTTTSTADTNSIDCSGQSTYIRDPTDCGKFYMCVYGSPTAMFCPAGLHFNTIIMVCDWPANVSCP